jgi:hypothetical protein
MGEAEKLRVANESAAFGTPPKEANASSRPSMSVAMSWRG